jgi:RNA-directed DNA polymerase
MLFPLVLGIPATYDRVCQQALQNRLEPVFELIFDDASFGYRRGRSAKNALRKIRGGIQVGAGRVVDADLRDFFDTINHGWLMKFVGHWVIDPRILRLIRKWLRPGDPKTADGVERG